MLRELHNSPIGLFRPALALARPNTLLGPLGGIDHSDLHHIYHHLRSGCILQLQPVQGLEHQHLFFQASYGGLNLGVLSRPLADRILQLEAEGRPYRVTVAELVREKYLPPTAVHVLLEWGIDD
jgi:hypothetical protein